MKDRFIATLLVAVLAVALGAGSAQAGWFDKKEKKSETPGKAHRYDFFPTMSYHMGTLRREAFSGWKLDDTQLQFIKGVRVTAGGVEGAMLQEGEKALVMGSRVGDVIIAWRVRVMESEWNVTPDRSGNDNVVWSTSDPTVGEGPTTE